MAVLHTKCTHTHTHTRQCTRHVYLGVLSNVTVYPKVSNDALSECGWLYLGGPWTWLGLIVPVHTRCTGGPVTEALGVEGHLTGRGRGGGWAVDGRKGGKGGKG